MGHSHGHQIDIQAEQFQIPARAKTFSFVAMVVGLVLTAVGMFSQPAPEHHAAAAKTEHTQEATAQANHSDAHLKTASAEAAAPAAEHHAAAEADHFKPMNRFWANLLACGWFMLLISVGGLFFVALQYIANAGWSAAVVRIPQAMLTFMPVAIGIILLVAVAARQDLYHWAHYEHLHLKPGDEGYDKILAGKSGFLNTGFYFAAFIIVTGIWYFVGRKLRSLSLSEDNKPEAKEENGGNPFFRKSIRWSAFFTVFYGFSFSMLSWLIVMSVDAHWFSTIYSIYNFATGWVSTLTIICLFVLFLRSKGYLKIVSDEHIHDLGKFMFAFTIFWTYIWLAQYLLIWYAHLPEEVKYYYDRLTLWQDNYKWHFWGNLIVNFLLPFLVLMTRNNKRNPLVLSIIGTIILIGHYNDVWLEVMPGTLGAHGHFGLMEIGMPVFFGGLFVYWVLVALTKRSLIAVNHPYIHESAHHDVGP